MSLTPLPADLLYPPSSPGTSESRHRALDGLVLHLQAVAAGNPSYDGMCDEAQVLRDACFQTVPGFRLDPQNAPTGPRVRAWEASDYQRRPVLQDTEGAYLRFQAGSYNRSTHYSRIYRMIGDAYLPELPTL